METLKLNSFKLIGLKLPHKTTNKDGKSAIDCGNLWQKFETQNFKDQIPDKINNNIYAVYFDYVGDYNAPFSYFIGCKVPMKTPTPEGLDYLLIPSKNYKKFTAKGVMPQCISNAWKHIWDTVTERAYLYDFEVYDERSSDWNNAEIDIFIS